MQKKHFLELEKLKNTESAQLSAILGWKFKNFFCTDMLAILQPYIKLKLI